MAAACLNASLGFLCLTLLFTLTPSTRQALTETTERRARVAGASHVNLRSGPGIGHPPVTILKNGEEVNVEKLEGSWYRVSLPDGLRGYVYAELILFIPEKTEQEQEQTAAPATPPTPTIEVSLEASTIQPEPETLSPEPVIEPVVEQPEETLPTPEETLPTPIVEARVVVPVEKTPATPPKIQSPPPKTQAVVPRKIETAVPVKASRGRVWGIVSWVLVPSCIFVLGWILGGNYYLRRDRIERTKLRF